ncbi:hypothetical protein KTR66_04725 [Roseococcus sp. SDR]|uniref:hypothetical protein n=1 Tax=Roseococcus sp. SDR TaxID=2835532 RepID=UPI001BCEC264|nr:hypothetical protein [Roseococcus sp. SDR]MBS7789284.1 hypothetical protein [Roseococcus sp. SDR]MBV1844598.1 hypothetical protein [Roseococcus sp. SDR]
MTDTGFARWEIWVQDTDPSDFTFTDDADAPLDLTGMTFRLSIEWAGGALLLVSGVDAEIVVRNQAVAETKGLVTVNLSAAQRALLPVDGSTIRFNIQRVDGALKLSAPYGEITAVKWVANA